MFDSLPRWFSQSPGPISRRGFMGLALLTGMGIAGLAAAQPSAAALLQQGLDRYRQGEYQAAISLWQSAIPQLQQQADRLQQGLGLIYLSLAHQQLGHWSEAERTLDQGFQALETAPQPQRERVRAQALNAQGSLQLALGQPEQALSSWQQAQAAYTQAADPLGQIGSQINQTQALQALGLNQRAKQLLQNLEGQLQSLGDPNLRITGLTALGNAQRSTGQLQAARQTLENTLELAEEVEDPNIVSGLQLDLGNTLQDIADRAFEINDRVRGVPAAEAAQVQYQAVIDRAQFPSLQIQAQLNLLNLHLTLLAQSQIPPVRVDPAEDLPSIDSQRHQDRLAQLWPTLLDQLTELPPSRPVLYGRINLATSLLDLYQLEETVAPSLDQIGGLLEETLRLARQTDDLPALAYGLGTQGSLYLQSQRLDQARPVTEQALLVAQSINAPEVSYLWQRQMGQIFRRQDQTPAALAAYESAYQSLQSLRRDLVSVSPSLQFSYRDSVEPVYREYIELLMDSSQPEPAQLRRSREVLESLQTAELNNFFRDSCLDTTVIASPIELDQVDPQAAILYPIVLSDRLELIVSLSGQPLRSYRIPVSSSEVEATTSELRRQVVKLIDPSGFLEPAQQIYEWLIRPALADLEAAQVSTLVFVMDSLLRDVPVATLYDRDRQQFLVERYDLALTPGLQLLDPKPLPRQELRALKAGLTTARQGFTELVNVSSEIDQVATQVPGEQLLNEQFTTTGLAQRLRQTPPPVVHLATHGQFSSRADQTFLLTWDDRIDIETLAALLHSSEPQGSQVVELLTLSACETASGDDRAALGLAGVAVRAGARSTLASLWAVNDASTTELMAQFYQILIETPISKAAALRQAQTRLLEDPQFQHPYFWAPFVLVGNWL